MEAGSIQKDKEKDKNTHGVDAMRPMCSKQ